MNYMMIEIISNLMYQALKVLKVLNTTMAVTVDWIAFWWKINF